MVMVGGLVYDLGTAKEAWVSEYVERCGLVGVGWQGVSKKRSNMVGYGSAASMAYTWLLKPRLNTSVYHTFNRPNST